MNFNRKRRYLGKLIADLQTNKVENEPDLQKKRIVAVPFSYNLHLEYEFFLVGEINLEIHLGGEEDYYPIGVKQSPLNKWRPFQKAETFYNRIEMTVDTSHPGLSEFQFLIDKLQGCQSDVLNQLGLYLRSYQHFVRRIREKMLNHPVSPRLYEFKFQNFIKLSTEFVGKLPEDGLYAVSIFQLDYQICNTKRIKFIVSKGLVELMGGVSQEEAAEILLRKGWMEVFGGPQRILKNIMLLNRLMKEGEQLLTFSVWTVDRIRIQVQAEIEIVQSLRCYVDVGFAEMIRFSVSQDVVEYLAQVRSSRIQEAETALHFNKKNNDFTNYEMKNVRHPNLINHKTDKKYNKKCKYFTNKFYTEEEIIHSQRVESILKNTSYLKRPAKEQLKIEENDFSEFIGNKSFDPLCESCEGDYLNNLPSISLEEQLSLFKNKTEFSQETISNNVETDETKFQELQFDSQYIAKTQSLINNTNNYHHHNSQINEFSDKQEEFSDKKEEFEQEGFQHSKNLRNSLEKDKEQEEQIDFDSAQIDFFNIFEDESLNVTAQDLSNQRKRIQKLLYNQYKEQFH